MSTAGKTIHCRAAVLRSPGEGLILETIRVEPPQAGEVRVKILYSSICHTDLISWNEPSTFQLPLILGHEGSGIVESVGEGVTEIQPGDHVVTVFLGECGKCKLCKTKLTNLCAVTANMVSPVMPSDQKTRFFAMDGSPINHFLNTSTFTEYTVMLEAAVAKVSHQLPLEEAGLLSCGVTTGLGSALNIAKVEPDSTVAVIGLGTVGLAAIQGAKLAGASRIIGIDIQPAKFEKAKAFGATDCLNPKDYETSIDKVVHQLVPGGVDYSFDCVGKPQLILDSINSCTMYGTTVIVGVTPADDDKLTISPREMLTGRQLKGGYYGGFRAKSQAQKLEEMCLTKQVNLEDYITHRLPFSKLNEGFQLLKEGCCIKCVIDMNL